MTTPQDFIASRRALLAGVTDGPWEHETAEFRDQRSHCIRTPDADGWNGVIAHTGYGFECSRAEADAAFIASARQDVPLLLDALADVLALCDDEEREEREAAARFRQGNVRCMSCDLRHEERQEYGCHEDGRGHRYDERELAEAAVLRDKDTCGAIPADLIRAAIARRLGEVG